MNWWMVIAFLGVLVIVAQGINSILELGERLHRYHRSLKEARKANKTITYSKGSASMPLLQKPPVVLIDDSYEHKTTIQRLKELNVGYVVVANHGSLFKKNLLTT